MRRPSNGFEQRYNAARAALAEIDKLLYRSGYVLGPDVYARLAALAKPYAAEAKGE